MFQTFFMINLRIHYLQHVPFEGLGYIETWVRENGHALSSTRFYEDEVLPAPGKFDWLIVMGGPMSIDDEDQYSWLKAEKDFIRKAIDEGKVVIGICLGAQLIAHVLNADVYPNHKKEIGWFPVDIVRQAGELAMLSSFPKSLQVLHWHGDTFNIPEDAVHLISSEACSNQAFLYKDRVLGLQFHLEATVETLQAMTVNCGDELLKAESVQSADKIIKGEKFCKETNAVLKQLLFYFQNA